MAIARNEFYEGVPLPQVGADLHSMRPPRGNFPEATTCTVRVEREVGEGSSHLDDITQQQHEGPLGQRAAKQKPLGVFRSPKVYLISD